MQYAAKWPGPNICICFALAPKPVVFLNLIFMMVVDFCEVLRNLNLHKFIQSSDSLGMVIGIYIKARRKSYMQQLQKGSALLILKGTLIFFLEVLHN